MGRPCRFAGALVRAVVVGGAVAVAVSSCGPGAQAPADPAVVARIDDAVITVDDVQREVDLRAGRAAPIPELTVLVDDLVERRILVDKAIAEGLDRDPELRRSWENLLISRYKEIHLHEHLRSIDVTDEEIAARYEADVDRYSRAPKARLAILTLPFSSVMTDEEREAVVARMGEARRLAVEESDHGPGPGFGTLAVRYSEDQVTRHRGGDTGWLDAGVDYRWPRDVVRAGFALEVGETSEPIVTDAAVHLVRKIDARPGERIPLARVRDQIRKELVSAAIREREADFAGDLKTDVAIELFPETLESIRMPVAPTGPGALARDEPPPSIP